MSILNVFPLLPTDLPWVLIRKRGSSSNLTNFRNFTINVVEIMEWLRFLKIHHPMMYREVDLTAADEHALNVLWTCFERALNVLWTCFEHALELEIMSQDNQGSLLPPPTNHGFWWRWLKANPFSHTEPTENQDILPSKYVLVRESTSQSTGTPHYHIFLCLDKEVQQ